MPPTSFDPVPDADLIATFASTPADGSDEGDLDGLFVRWLVSDATPEDWHRFVMDMNWDQTEDVLPWIVSQPRCDKGTALLVFWRAQPDFYLQFGGCRPDSAQSYDLLCAIRDRWEAGFYTASEFAFDLADDVYGASAMRAAGMEHMIQMIDFNTLTARYGHLVDEWMPPGMRQTLQGRRLDTMGVLEGIPLRFWPPELWPSAPKPP